MHVCKLVKTGYHIAEGRASTFCLSGGPIALSALYDAPMWRLS